MLLLLVALSVSGCAQSAEISKEVDAVYPAAHDLYIDLHQSPELSSHETQTAAKLAARLRTLGYEVTEQVGGTGIVAILKNGAGPQSCCAPNWTRFQSKKRPDFPSQAKYTPKTMPDSMSQ